MKIYDCFMYFDEEMILDLRLNILNKHVDYFVIVESSFTHKGDKRSLQFNSKKFEKFKEKIIYLVYDNKPKDIKEILSNDNEDIKSEKYISNSIFIHIFFNIIWSIFFFGLHQILLALIVLVILIFLIIILILKFKRVNYVSSYLMIPYLLWSCYALFLNFNLYILN